MNNYKLHGVIYTLFSYILFWTLPTQSVLAASDPVGGCTDSATFIHDIQGSGALSTDVGNIREIKGIVTGDFEGISELGGFFMQEEDADADADPSTSEGIFVFHGGGAFSVNPGDTVRVRGTVDEFLELTQLNSIVSVTDCPSTGTTTPTTWHLPVADVADWEQVEGMEISIPQTLYATGNHTQGRYGEVDLSLNAPLDAPTNVVEPGSAAIARQELNDRSRIQLGDASNEENPLPLPPYLGASNTLRTGDTLTGIAAIVNYAHDTYQLEPIQPVNFTRVNARTSVPGVGGSIQVAGFNVLNYFTTIDTGAPICGPLGTQVCRGADTPEEFTRQREKIFAALQAMDADVVGLIELENHPASVPTADLVSGLNDVMGAGTYDYILTGAIGANAIRAAIIFKPATVTPLGTFAILDSSVDPSFNDARNRPVLAQTFRDISTGGALTVAVNHLKSKGSDCNAIGDPDTGDGSGNCNLTRTSAATALVNWLATDPTGSGDDDFLIIGDLNSYSREAPIDAIINGGYTDLIKSFLGTGFGAGAYSFTFFGQSGDLDYGLANTTLTPQVTGANFWRINSVEPSGLDYNNYNQPGLYMPDQFRSSDHDPVLIGLQLVPVADLSVSISDIPDPVTAGTTITFNIAIKNAGPDDAVDVGVSYIQPLPFQCTFTSVATGGASGNTGTGSGGLDETLQLPSGSEVTYTMTCKIERTSKGTIFNTTTISAVVSDPNDSNNSETDQVDILPQRITEVPTLPEWMLLLLMVLLAGVGMRFSRPESHG